MLYGSLEPNERFRARRAQARRRRRIRRALVAGALLVIVLSVVGGWQFRPAHRNASARAPEASVIVTPSHAVRPRPLPVEVRGVHVTGALASIPGKLAEYAALRGQGLNTIVLDVKDESGRVGFAPAGVPLARTIGATRSFYDPRAVVRMLHSHGIYVVGRIVVFQDSVLARARPDLAVQRSGGSVWTTSSGFAWLDPYDRRAWSYAVGIARAAARAGFDEIMFDYVRFPSDGDLAHAVYPARTSESRGHVIGDFAEYAVARLRPLGVRVSTALFGLSATQDLGVGQVPRWVSRYVDTVSPMAYPVLYSAGELGLADPSSEPGETVFRTLADFHRQLQGSDAHLVPWIQDWGYDITQVRAQIDAARLQGAKGYLLWNAEGLYTPGALAPPP
jgi:hypothetical protein